MTKQERRTQHLANLRALGFTGTLDQLYRLERKAHAGAERLCTYDNFDWEKFKESILRSAARLFGGKLPAGFFVNGDPRGHALKIRDEQAKNLLVYKDWGGYGILAPDFTE